MLQQLPSCSRCLGYPHLGTGRPGGANNDRNQHFRKVVEKGQNGSGIIVGAQGRQDREAKQWVHSEEGLEAQK